jgi:hypothetical protein
LHFFPAKPERRTAAIHRRIAAAEHDHALADLVGMAEGDARQPVDADMNVFRRFRAAGNVEIAATRRAATDKDCVPAFGDERLQAVNAPPADELNTEIESIAAFLVDHIVG